MGKSNKKKLLVTPASSKTKAVAKTTRPSPDSVVCIDLTDSNGQDFADRPGKERRLGTVRKEVGPASSSAVQRKRGGLKTTGLENAGDCDEVIIIDSDDDSSSIGGKGISILRFLNTVVGPRKFCIDALTHSFSC